MPLLQHPGKSTAQIALRWLVQHGHPFTTATGREEYIKVRSEE
jgi:diketogulonate reductase-like aldo/keto reductase